MQSLFSCLQCKECSDVNTEVKSLTIIIVQVLSSSITLTSHSFKESWAPHSKPVCHPVLWKLLAGCIRRQKPLPHASEFFGAHRVPPEKPLESPRLPAGSLRTWMGLNNLRIWMLRELGLGKSCSNEAIWEVWRTAGAANNSETSETWLKGNSTNFPR